MIRLVKFQLLVTRFFRVLRQLHRIIPPDWWWKKLVKYQILQKMVVICYVPPRFASFRNAVVQPPLFKDNHTTTLWGSGHEAQYKHDRFHEKTTSIRHVDQKLPGNIEVSKKTCKKTSKCHYFEDGKIHKEFSGCGADISSNLKHSTNPSLLPAITMSTMSDLRWTMQLFISKK